MFLETINTFCDEAVKMVKLQMTLKATGIDSHESNESLLFDNSQIPGQFVTSLTYFFLLEVA